MLRLTARARLTLVHTGLVAGAGAVLSVLTFVLLERGLRGRFVLIRGSGGIPTVADGGRLPPEAEQFRAEALRQLVVGSAIALVTVTLLSAAIGWLIAGRMLRPIRTISATARRLSATNLGERVAVHAPADELAGLAGIVNDMLDRIQLGVADRDRLLESQRMFVANAAHELRTPLATMRTAIDVTLDGRPDAGELTAMAVDVRTAADHMRRTLDGLLTLARSQTGTDTPQPVDLADLVAEALTGVEARTDLRPARTAGEPVLLERMVGNLVDNALRYNHPGGHVTVSTGTAGRRAVLRIANTGPPVADVHRLFEPFVRADRTNPGLGLGLSIVRAVVTAHHGVLTAVPHPTGGLDITVSLPQHPPAGELR